MDNEELENLLARCALRDQKALELLYQQTASYLNAVAYRMVGDSDASNDVLQEAFVQIWDKAGDYAPSMANPLTWMTSIVRYRAIDKLRREKRHQNRPGAEEEDDILMSASTGETQEELYQKSQLSEQVNQCLEGMNEKFKKSVELAYLYGYSREELAEVLATNVNTVKSWLRRGAAKLKECLEGKNGGTAND